MKIEFDQNYNFIEIKRSSKGIEITLSSKEPKQPLTSIVNSVILPEEQFKKLIAGLDLDNNS